MQELREVALFRTLDDAGFEALSRVAIRRRFRKDEVLFFEGDRPERLSVLVRGELKLYKSSEQYREVVLHRFSPVTLVAEMALLNRIPYPATARFETDGEVLQIDYAAFEKLFLDDPRYARLMILSLTEKIRALEAVIERNMIMSAEERLLDFIARTPERFGSVPQYEIARELNMAPETLSRTLRRLVKGGRLRREGERYIPASPEAD